MNAAEITGKKARSRGLRHSMGVMLALDKVPLNVIQDILGHQFPESTQIYMQVPLVGVGKNAERFILSLAVKDCPENG